MSLANLSATLPRNNPASLAAPRCPRSPSAHKLKAGMEAGGAERTRPGRLPWLRCPHDGTPRMLCPSAAGSPCPPPSCGACRGNPGKGSGPHGEGSLATDATDATLILRIARCVQQQWMVTSHF